MEMNNNYKTKMRIGHICLIFILVSFCSCDLKCPPTSSKEIDMKWAKDPTNDKEKLYGYIFRTVISDTQYNDEWSGFTYEPIPSICFNNGVREPYSSINVVDNINSIYGQPKINSNIRGLYSKGCRISTGTKIPINFRALSLPQSYDIIFDIANPTKSNILLAVSHDLVIVYSQTIQANSVSQVKLTLEINAIGGATINSVPVGNFDLTAANPSYIPTGVTGNNMVLTMSGNGLIITTYSIMYRRKNTNQLNYNGNSNCDADETMCIENYSCQKPGNKCTKCGDQTCSKCDDDLNALDKCTECPPTSINWNKGKQAAGKCIIDHMDFTKINKITLEDGPNDHNGNKMTQVPPAIHWRVTFEFWTFITYPGKLTKLNAKIIYKDFLSMIITQNEAGQALDNDINMICIPIEWLYKLDELNSNTQVTQFLKNKLGIEKPLKVEFKDIQSKWFHTRCAFNLDSSKMYMNDQVETVLEVPKIYNRDSSDILFHMKKFYKSDQYTDLLFKDFDKIPTNIYLKNLNIFREYLPKTMITKHLNLHKFTQHHQFPQLLYVVPFDDIERNANNNFKFKTYNYYNRVSKADNVIIKTENEITVKPGEGLIPPRNFQRLTLLDNDNKEFADCEYKTKTDLQCDKAKHFDKCFDNNLPYVCEEKLDLPFYLDVDKLTCNQECPYKVIHSPDDSSYQARSFCMIPCDTQADICPFNSQTYTKITDYTCQTGFFDLYYRCYPNNENVEKNALFFSGYLNSHTIIIDLQKSYENYAIETWFYFDQRFQVTNEEIPENELRNYMIFLTNHFRFKRGGTNYPYNNIEIINGGVESTADEITTKGWNHFIFSVDKQINGERRYYASINHHQYNKELKKENVALDPLHYIFFCNDEPNTGIPGYEAICLGTKWVDAYYRDIRVWDLTHTTRYSVFFGHHFIYHSNDDSAIAKNIMLKHYYTMNLDHLNKNSIKDIVSGKNGRVLFNEETIIQNPDNENMLNYESRFDIEEFESNKYIIEVSEEKRKASPTTGICPEGCKICHSLSKICIECKEGYALFDRTCKLKEETYYVYKNPGINMPTKLSLNIHENEIRKNKYVTIFFFIKLYGFTEDPLSVNDAEKIIIFNSVDNFYFGYDPANNLQSVYFSYKGNKIFEYSGFRQKHFGHWVPVSIAAFRESQRLEALNMVSASIHYSNLVHMTGKKMETLNFNEFTLTNTWIGLISDIKIYNHFIVNAWGIVKYNEYGESEMYLLHSLLLKTSANNVNNIKCLEQKEILTTPDSSYKIECVEDYNPHWDQCGGKTSNFVPWDQTISCQGQCLEAGNPNRCLGVDTALRDSDNGSGSNLTCENVNKRWIDYFLYFQASQVTCAVNPNTDYARYKSVEVKNGVDSPSGVFSIDFWFYTQTFNNENSKNLKTNNFKSFEIVWDYHIRFKVESIPDNKDDPNIVRTTYTAYCTPVISIAQPSNDPSPNSLVLGDVKESWVYLSCGVNLSSMKTYLSKSTTKQNEITFTTKNVIPIQKVSFSIKENSPLGYGVTFIKELRLWNCYDCALGFRNQDYFPDDFNFNNVLHCFRGKNPGEGLDFVDEAGKVNGVKLDSPDNYPGYNILEVVNSYVTCDETDYEYYNPTTNSCEIQYNLARLNDFSFTIPSSRTGRYTIEFWIFVEDSIQLTQGFNIIWNMHMSIAILRDSATQGTIRALCFPQAYRDDLNGKKGLEIYELYNNALNKEQHYYHDSSNSWIFVRCAMDQSRKIYGMNDQTEKELLAESLYGNVRNYRAFRFFDITKTTQLLFQHAKDNYTRIFLRSFRAYREYIDNRIDLIKYTDLSGYIGRSFWPLVIYIDFIKYSITNGLEYSTYDETIDDNKTDEDKNGSRKTEYLANFLQNNDPYYPSYPDLYVLKLCAGGQTGGDKVVCQGTGGRFCYHGSGCTKYFFPDSNNKYLNMDTLTLSDSCGDFTRLPDSRPEKAFCLIDCISVNNNINNCAKSAALIGSYTTYQKEYTCDAGFTRVYYECIKDDLIPSSAMYFSNEFSFNSLTKTMVNDNIESYYLEFWFKLDALNYNKEITQQEYYLLAPPHKIIQDNVDQQFKYANEQISSGTLFYSLQSINQFEWNRVIIKTKKENGVYSINIYINYNFDQSEVEITGLTNDMTLKGVGFCNQPFANCEINGNKYNPRWGVAWYRNLRIWKEGTTSLELIQAAEISYTQLLKSMYYYYQLTIDYINENRLEDRINPNANALTSDFWFANDNYDNEMRENYSTNTFDYSFYNPSTFISGLTDDGSNYQFGNCDTSCKRCYSATSTNCYECNDGYALYGKECKTVTGYYFKTPPKNNQIKSIKLKTSIANPVFDLETTNPLTITIWMRYFGISLEEQDTRYYPIIYLYNTDSFFGYDSTEEEFVIRISDKDNARQTITAYRTKIKNYVGQWCHFGFSVHRSDANNIAQFPHMFNFMIDHQVLLPTSEFDPQLIPVYINTVTFNTAPVAEYSNIKFFSNFWFGTFGHINAIQSTRTVDMIYEVKLFGSATDNCISNSELDGVTASTLQPVCISDYLPYDDTNKQCTSDSNFIDLDYQASPPCDKCNSICLTQCFDNTAKGCSHAYNQGLYWTATHDHPNEKEYYSQRVDSVNFAFYEKVEINDLMMTPNDEFSLEFWVYIYEYNDGTFENLDVIWDKQARVNIAGNNGQLLVKCFPYTNKNNLASDAEFTTVNIVTKKWNHIRCMGDRYHKVYRINSEPEKSYTFPTINQDKSSLTVIDNTVKFNYGFSFIREVKLFASYNYDFWDNSGYILTSKKFEFLLHHFSFTFDGNDIKNYKAYDSIQQYYFSTKAKSNIIGYNYVKEYEQLPICNEGYCYNTVAKICELCDDATCGLLRENVPGKCLKCPSSKPYMKIGETCESDCSPGFYNDDFLSQCRICDPTCYTCDGKKVNNCVSCTGNLYLVPHLHICVPFCEAYDMTPLQGPNDPPNTCGGFSAEAEIVTPDITEVIDLRTFNEIVARIYDETSPITSVGWTFNRLESINLNINYRDFDDSWIPINQSPFIGVPNSLQIQVNTPFFRQGLKYVFYLTINAEKGGHVTSLQKKFILTMNDFPITGLVNPMPSKGYTSTNFLFTCNECTDDNSKSEELEYKFTYFTDINDPSTETLLKDFDKKSEVLKTFNKVNPPNNEYVIRCYCKDKFDEVSFSETKITADLPPNESGVNIDISESIKNIDIKDDVTLNSEQISNRAEFLSTITVDYPKSFQLNRTNVTSPQELLDLFDPASKYRDPYCNNRGASYPIDRFLMCDCSNYHGVVCQIDSGSFKDLISIFVKLYKKAISAQTQSFDESLFNSIHLLIKSGSMFMPIDNMSFIKQGIEFITLCIRNFKDEMMDKTKNRYLVLIDFYNSMFEYGMYITNSMKISNFQSENSKLASGMYDEETIRTTPLTKEQIEIMNNYFSEIRTGLDNLMKFYAQEKFEFRYIGRNFNLYVMVVSEGFDYNKYFELEKSLYEPYFDISRCTPNKSAKMILIGKIFRISPYMQKGDLYDLNTTPVISIELLDHKTAKKVYITDCGSVANAIEIYFPVSSYTMVEKINSKKKYLSPENQYDITADIFNDPVFIDKKGNVDNSTTTSRINEYFVPFNLSCKYYTENEDQNQVEFAQTGVDYTSYTEDNYVQCKAMHLTDFVVENYDVSGEFKINTRFFYLKHYMLLGNINNYKGNPMLNYFIIMIVVYFAVIICYSIFSIYFSKKVDLLNFLKLSIIKINLPYRKTYDFDNELNLPDEIKQRIDNGQKRTPYLEDTMDVNNVNVMVMADKIGNYDKQFQTQRNNIANQKDFFREETRPEKKSSNGKLRKTESNTPFFRNNDDDIEEHNLGTANKQSEECGSRDAFDKERDKIDNNKSSKEKVQYQPFNTFGNPIKKKSELDTNRLNKFFNGDFNMPPNPPIKKGEYIETKKVANQNMIFFENNKTLKQKGEDNPFQKGFDNYNPKFAKPKVISQKLAFYEKDKFSEKDSSHTNYKGGQLSIRSGLSNFQDKEAHIRTEVIRNNQSDDKINETTKEELPNLFKNLTREKKLLEFSRLTLTPLEFFCKNFYQRFILFSSFARFSVCYSRYKRIGNLLCQLSLYSLILSICFTADANMEIKNRSISSEIILFILFCIIASIGSNLLCHLPAFMFYIDVRKFRVLYTMIRENEGLEIMKYFNNLIKKNIWWDILGVIIQWVFTLVSFYFSFGFCATYYYQKSTLIFGCFIAITIDFILFEPLWELIISGFYAVRNKGRGFIVIGEFLNRTRNMRVLV